VDPPDFGGKGYGCLDVRVVIHDADKQQAVAARAVPAGERLRVDAVRDDMDLRLRGAGQQLLALARAAHEVRSRWRAAPTVAGVRRGDKGAGQEARRGAKAH
jgi:hypothetical protein